MQQNEIKDKYSQFVDECMLTRFKEPVQHNKIKDKYSQFVVECMLTRF